MKIELIKPYTKNAKKHPKQQIEKIAKSIKEFGFNQPIVVDKDNVIIVGHGRYEAAKLLELSEVPTIQVDLTEQQAKSYRLADNKLNESDWDMGIVIEELKELPELFIDLTGFDKDLIIESNEKDDEVPAIPKQPQSKLGDLYILGNHRVLCGDSTKKEDVEKLMDGKKADCVVTDPPYNTGMERKKDEKARLSHMFTDNIENWEEFLENVFINYFENTKSDCVFYCFIDWRSVGDVRKEIEKYMNVKNIIVWDKKVHGLGSDYKSTYELCIVGKKGKPKINNRFDLDYQDIWRLQREIGRNKMHATVKPVELLEKPIKHASKQDDIILDLFLGSGSTLIACQKTNRICYGMEINPKYIDVIVQRYCDYVNNYDIIKNGEKITWNKQLLI